LPKSMISSLAWAAVSGVSETGLVMETDYASARRAAMEDLRQDRVLRLISSPPRTSILSPPLQQADEKPVSAGAQRRHRQALRADPHSGKERAGLLSQRSDDLVRRKRREVRMPGHERGNLRAILGLQHRAGDVGKPPARP